jgi:hypothetical protein
MLGTIENLVMPWFTYLIDPEKGGMAVDMLYL